MAKMKELEGALRKWCDLKLIPGKCYGDNSGKPFETKEEEGRGKLVYQEGSSGTYHDVYLLDDDTYRVYSVFGDADSMDMVCDDLAGVLDHIVDFGNWNTTTEMLVNLTEQYEWRGECGVVWRMWRKTRIPLLSRCTSHSGVIAAIEKLIEEIQS